MILENFRSLIAFFQVHNELEVDLSNL